jgi:hypothetical protein
MTLLTTRIVEQTYSIAREVKEKMLLPHSNPCSSISAKVVEDLEGTAPG